VWIESERAIGTKAWEIASLLKRVFAQTDGTDSAYTTKQTKSSSNAVQTLVEDKCYGKTDERHLISLHTWRQKIKIGLERTTWRPTYFFNIISFNSSTLRKRLSWLKKA
jgi:hypothetical protein